jgi:hypothetical protein
VSESIQIETLLIAGCTLVLFFEWLWLNQAICLKTFFWFLCISLHMVHSILAYTFVTENKLFKMFYFMHNLTKHEQQKEYLFFGKGTSSVWPLEVDWCVTDH